MRTYFFAVCTVEVARAVVGKIELMGTKIKSVNLHRRPVSCFAYVALGL